MPYKQRGADSRISPLVAVGGMLLSGVAGYVNSVSLAFFHIPVSHMSGAATHAGADLAAGDLHAVLFALGIMGSFLLGAGLSGLIIGAARFTPGKRYGLAMLAEGIILTVTAFVIASGRSAGPLLAALACGLQNGMASSYFGLIIRTTHVTGILTDLGVLLGQAPCATGQSRCGNWGFSVRFSSASSAELPSAMRPSSVSSPVLS